MMKAGRKKDNFQKGGFLSRLIEDLGLIVPLVKDYRSGAYGKFPILSLAALLFTVVYVVSPVDLIPDYILGLGQIDDATVVGLCLYLMEKDLRKYKKWRTSREREDRTD